MEAVGGEGRRTEGSAPWQRMKGRQRGARGAGSVGRRGCGRDSCDIVWATCAGVAVGTLGTAPVEQSWNSCSTVALMQLLWSYGGEQQFLQGSRLSPTRCSRGSGAECLTWNV